MHKKGRIQRVFLRGGGGTESQRLVPTAQAATWGQYERGIKPLFNKIFASENAFQGI